MCIESALSLAWIMNRRIKCRHLSLTGDKENGRRYWYIRSPGMTFPVHSLQYQCQNGKEKVRHKVCVNEALIFARNGVQAYPGTSGVRLPALCQYGCFQGQWQNGKQRVRLFRRRPFAVRVTDIEMAHAVDECR